MYDHDEEQIFAMLIRMDIEPEEFEPLVAAMRQIEITPSLRFVWSSEKNVDKPRLAVCCTFVEHTRAVLEAVRDGLVRGEVAVVISNRKKLKTLAEEFGVPFE